MSIPFNELLAPSDKLAQAQVPSEQQFEIDFANLASAALRDRAGPILPHVLGFEVVERAPDNSKGVGIFAAKVGDEFYYVPVFFRDGQIVGMDSVFAKKTNTLMPITEDTLAKIVNKAKVSIGRGARVSSNTMRGFENPQLQGVMSGPQQAGQKYAGADIGMAAWEALKSAAAATPEGEPQVVYAQLLAHMDKTSIAAASEGRSLSGLLTELADPGLCRAAADMLLEHPKLAHSLLQLYDGSLDDMLAVVDKAEATRPTLKAAVEFVGVSDLDACCAPTSERRRLVRSGFAVVDRRAASQRGTILPVSAESVFTNPTDPGCYDVVLADGSVRECGVLARNRRISGQQDTRLSAVVFDKANSSRFFSADGSAVLVMGDIKGGLSDLLAMGIPVNRIAPHATYMLVDRTGLSVGPLYVTMIEREGDRKLLVRCREEGSPSYGGGLSDGTFAGNNPRTYGERPGAGQACYDPTVTLLLIQRTGDMVIDPLPDGARIIVPSDCRLIEIKHDYTADSRAFAPTTNAMVTANVLKCAQDLGIRYDATGRSYDLWLGPTRSASLTEKQAMARLMTDGHMAAEDADAVLAMAQASPGRTKTAQIAFPADDPSAGQFSMPLIDRTIPGQEANTQALTGQVLNNGVQLPSSTPGLDQSYMGQPNDQDISELMSLAEHARASGQRTIMDHGMVGTLARVHDVGAVIDAMIPKFRGMLDGLGRLLFLFHWKPEEWSERYGDDRRQETQDSLLNLYKGLGDLSSRLEETKIEGDAALA